MAHPQGTSPAMAHPQGTSPHPQGTSPAVAHPHGTSPTCSQGNSPPLHVTRHPLDTVIIRASSIITQCHVYYVCDQAGVKDDGLNLETVNESKFGEFFLLRNYVTVLLPFHFQIEMMILLM